MDTIFEIFTSEQFYFTAIRMMTPILYAALACQIFIRGGIDPIATEGIMLMTALARPLGGYFTNNAFLGVLFSMIIGAFLSFLFVLITNKLETNEILTGIAFNTFAMGITVFLLYYLTGEKGSTQSLKTPVVANINIGNTKIFSGHNVLTYLAILMVLLIYILLYKTPSGIKIRAVGESPGAASSVGISVLKTRYITAILAGSLIGLGGAFMSMGYVQGFSRNMIAGRGFIGMAANGMGGSNLLGVLLSSLLFGLADSFAIRLQLHNVPTKLVQMIPYIVTIIVITIFSAISLQRERRKKH